MRGGDWVRVPRGAQVRNEATREVRARLTTYPLRLLRVEEGRAYWLGDRDQLYSAPVRSLELIPGGHKRGSKTQRTARQERRARAGEQRVVRCPHGFLPPLCCSCHQGEQ